MRLLNARVRAFRNIVDSTEVEIDEAVTCLVGKNESGKTAFMEALWRLNPHRASQFDRLEDYPRWRLRRDEKAGTAEEAIPIEATFELDDEEVALIEERYGTAALQSPTLQVARNYGGDLAVKADVDEYEVLKHELQSLPDESELRKAVAQKKTPETIAAAWKAQRETSDPGTDSEEKFDRLIQVGARRLAGELVKPRIPTFFYFDRYSELPGRFPLSRILETEVGSLETAEQTARALLELARGEANNLTAEDYERRVAELEAAANHVTQEVLEYWSQNDRLRVSFDIDKQIEKRGANQEVVERYMEVRLHDDRHMYTTNLGTRSSGFRWFFSFIVAFSEIEERPEGVIVLLDEPGLNLHARAQKDFLRFIEERLAPQYQVVFTTHSPFMVDPKNLSRVRLVEDRTNGGEGEQGAIVTSDVLSIDRDTVFPLQGALGYDLAQHLMVGTDNLVVEGTSDLIYLNVMSRHLEDLSRTHLDLTQLTITPVGGASNVPTFVALLGNHLNVSVLVDSDNKVNQRLTDMVAKELLASDRLILVGEIVGETRADIEDLFSVEDYLKLYNAAFGGDLKPEDLKEHSKPMVKRIQDVGGVYDHGRPAEVLMRNAGDYLPEFSDQTLDRFEDLMRRINESVKGAEDA